jgi:hypothetical protein
MKVKPEGITDKFQRRPIKSDIFSGYDRSQIGRCGPSAGLKDFLVHDDPDVRLPSITKIRDIQRSGMCLFDLQQKLVTGTTNSFRFAAFPG